MISKVYLKYICYEKMAYNESTVVLGGLMHIPILIIFLRLVENRFRKNEINYQKN